MKVCIDCRLLVEDDSGCAPGHSVVAWDDPKLVDAVWGAGPVRRTRPSHVGDGLKASGKFGALGMAVTFVVCMGFSMCPSKSDVSITSSAFWIMTAVMMAIVVPALIYEQLDEHGVNWRDLLVWLLPIGKHHKPVGVSEPRPPAGAGARGKVVGEPVLRSPLADRTCVAWVAAVANRNYDVFLRAVQAASFRIELEDGARIDIPAGPIEIFPRVRDWRDPRSWLAKLFPGRPTGKRDPFPGKRGWEQIISAGDKVEVMGELDTVLDESSAGAGYRETPGTVLRPRGRPMVRVV